VSAEETSWRTLANANTPPVPQPEGEFAFLDDLMSLFTHEQARQMQDALAQMAKERRETESDGASLRLY